MWQTDDIATCFLLSQIKTTSLVPMTTEQSFFPFLNVKDYCSKDFIPFDISIWINKNIREKVDLLWLFDDLPKRLLHVDDLNQLKT